MTHAKYLIVLLRGREQAVRFPPSTHHKEIADLLHLPVIAAGFCVDDEWAGGESETLRIGSRGEKDRALIAGMLAAPARETWDLVTRLAEQEPELEIPFP